MGPKKYSNKRNRKQKAERFDNNNSGGLAETFAETGLDISPNDSKIERKGQSIINNISLEERYKESDKKVKYYLKNWKGISKTEDLDMEEHANFLKDSSTKSSNFDMAEGESSTFTLAFLDELVELTKLQLELGLAKNEILARGKRFALKKLAKRINDEDEKLRQRSSGTTEGDVHVESSDLEIDTDSSHSDLECKNVIGSETKSTICAASATTVLQSDLQDTTTTGGQNEIEGEMDVGDIETQKNDEPMAISGDLYKEMEEFLDNLDI